MASSPEAASTSHQGRSGLSQQRVIELAGALDERLGRQIAFITELDKLKGVLRRSLLIDTSRYENTAEHSWHLAMLALCLAEYAGDDVDLHRALKLVLVHDIVEIDAGDTYIYDVEASRGKEALEQAAADRLFGLLPEDQAAEFRSLWDEYETRDTPTGRFAYALDRLQPLLLNAASGGRSWREHGIAAHQVRAMNGPIVEGSEKLWSLAAAVIDEAVQAGALIPDDDVPRDHDA